MKERIKQLRKTTGLNQSDFGAKVGVKGNTIGNYELGLRNPSDAVIFSICREFDAREDWLRNGTGEMFIQKSRGVKIAEFTADLLKDEKESFRRRFVDALSELSMDEWELLANIAKKIAKEKD